MLQPLENLLKNPLASALSGAGQGVAQALGGLGNAAGSPLGGLGQALGGLSQGWAVWARRSTASPTA